MTNRITGPAIGKHRFGAPTASSGSEGASSSVGRQVEDTLFGSRRPELLDPDDEVEGLLARLDAYRKKLARLVGDAEEDYRLQLAATSSASIDIEGTIYVGRAFLLDTAEALALQVGVLSHEIGHRPRRWQQYRQEGPLDASGLRDLCRLEETRADYFAGFALAHLRFDCEPLCGYLQRVQVGPHPAYFTPALRAKTIREGFGSGQRRQVNLQKFFPELARMTSVTADLGKA